MSSFASLSTIPNLLPCSLLVFWPKTLTYLLFDISSFMLEKFINTYYEVSSYQPCFASPISHNIPTLYPSHFHVSLYIELTKSS